MEPSCTYARQNSICHLKKCNPHAQKLLHSIIKDNERQESSNQAQENITQYSQQTMILPCTVDMYQVEHSSKTGYELRYVTMWGASKLTVINNQPRLLPEDLHQTSRVETLHLCDHFGLLGVTA